MTAAAARPLELGRPALAGLAALGVPRVVLHDLNLVHEGTFVNGLLVFIPPLCWIAAVLWRRAPRPFLTVLAIGAIYGVMLAVVHQALWHVAFGDTGPSLGGRFTGLDPAIQELLMRTAAATSSVLTGLVVGVIAGAAAALLARIVPGRAKPTAP
jgi:hypothetical protein